MAKSLFDHLNAIYIDQSTDYFDRLDEADRKTFSTYMIHRLISMNVNFVPVVNEAQRYPLEPREAYLFYSQLLPKGKQFNKYIKASAAKTHEEWLVTVVAQYYGISHYEAIQYLNIFYADDAGKAALREICEFYGTDPKQIKKVKL